MKRSQQGDDLDENIVPLCMGPGTPDCHGKIEKNDRRARTQLRATLLPIEIEYILWKRNQEWLDQAYPVAA